MKFKNQKFDDNWDDEISKQAKQLKRFHPSDELWDKIESRLVLEINKSSATQKIRIKWYQSVSRFIRHFFTDSIFGNRVRVGLAVATSFLLVVLSTLFIYQRPINISSERKTEILAQLDQDIERTERQYQKIIKQLSKLAEQNEPNVDPHLLALYQEKLSLLDESIRECKKALEENHQNPEVQFALLESYHQKVETLKMIAQAKPEIQFKEIS